MNGDLKESSGVIGSMMDNIKKNKRMYYYIVAFAFLMILYILFMKFK